MANERLGSVHGEIIIDYDDKGVAHARVTLKQVGEDVDALDGKLKTSTKNQEENSKKIDSSLTKLRSALKSAHGDMDKLSTGASGAFLNVAKAIGGTIVAMGGLAIGGQLIGGLIGAVVSLIGVLAIVPGAILAIGLAMATIKLAQKGFEDFKNELKDLVPAIDDMKDAIGKALFNDLARQVKILAVDYLPIAKRGFVDIAKALNSAALGAAAFFKQAQTKSDTASVFEAARVVANNLSKALVALLPAFRDIGTVGAEVFASMTGGAVDVAKSFSDMIARFRESGELEGFMRNGIAALKDLGGILYDVFGIFNQLFGSIQGEGGGLLSTLHDITSAIKDWMHSLEGAKAIYAFGQILATIGSLLKDVFLEVLKQVGPILVAAAPGFETLAKYLAEQILPALRNIGPFLVDMAKWFSANADNIGPLLIAFAAFVAAVKVATIVMGILNAVLALNPFILIAAAIIALVVLVILYWDEIVAFLVKTWNWIKDTAVSIWNGIVDFFKGIWDGITGFITRSWEHILSDLSSIWSDIGTFFSDIWQGIKDTVVGWLTDIGDEFKRRWQIISDFFTGVWDGISSAISTALDTVKSIFTTAWTAIVNALRPIIEPIVSIITSIFEIIYTVISTTLIIIGLIFQKAWMIITDVFHAIWDPIATWWTNFWDDLKNVVFLIWTTITTWLQEKWDAAIAAWHAIFDPVIEWWNGFWQGISDWVTKTWDDLVAWLTQKWDESIAAWHTIFDPIIEWWNGFWDGISTKVSDVWDFIVAWLKAKWDAAIQAWHDLFDPIIEWWNGIWDTVTTAVADGVNNVVEWVKGIPGKIKDAVVGAADWLYNAGRDVVIGFLNGLKNMFGEAVQSIKNFANDIVSSAKSILGISSPSVVFRAFGEFTMQGYDEGIQSLKKKVVGTMGNISASIVNAGVLPKSTVPAGLMTTAVANATNSIRNSTQATTVNGVVVNVKGNLDPTNPVAWRGAIKGIRDGIVGLENDYAGAS